MSVFIIDDDEIMAECVANIVGEDAKVFSNAISAMVMLGSDNLPDLIFLDILLDGPDGFTFLNELASYTDTSKIPVVILSSLDFKGKDLSSYGVAGVLNKDKMRPEDIREYVKSFVG